jgi:hypothetical protein
MRLARVNAALHRSGSKLAALASAGALDLLQLDYPEPEARAYSAAFFEQLRTLHKQFFLEPSLRLVTNAGGGAVIACVERLGSYLREHGDAAMPITAVRGDNLLPRLSELTAAGIELTDESTGQPLVEIKQPLLSAQIELGAGPLAAAWNEGSRMAIAGCYDPAAPFIAASKAELVLAWDDCDALARVAVAAHAALLGQAIAEMPAPDQLTLETLKTEQLVAHGLVRKLRELALDGHLLRQADVDCDISSLAVCPTDVGGLSFAGVTGREPIGSWRVRLTFATGNMVDSTRRTEVRWSRVQRDAVHVSVDTRPASEWL